jgi:Tfp pilus assembly protein PilO
MNKILATTILFFITFLFVVYLLLPTYSQFKDLGDKTSKKEALFRKKEAYFLKLKKDFSNLWNYRDALVKINSALPETLEVAPLLSFFQEKSLENGLILESLSQVEETPSYQKKEKKEKKGAQPKLKEAGFSLNLKGGFPSFENFLRSLETSARMFEVERVTLKAAKGGILEISLLVKVYSYSKNQ